QLDEDRVQLVVAGTDVAALLLLLQTADLRPRTGRHARTRLHTQGAQELLLLLRIALLGALLGSVLRHVDDPCGQADGRTDRTQLPRDVEHGRALAAR